MIAMTRDFKFLRCPNNFNNSKGVRYLGFLGIFRDFFLKRVRDFFRIIYPSHLLMKSDIVSFNFYFTLCFMKLTIFVMIMLKMGIWLSHSKNWWSKLQDKQKWRLNHGDGDAVNQRMAQPFEYWCNWEWTKAALSHFFNMQLGCSPFSLRFCPKIKQLLSTCLVSNWTFSFKPSNFH